MNVLIMADYRTQKSGNFIASLLELANRMREAKNEAVFLFPEGTPGGYLWSKWLEANGHTVMFLNDNDNDEIVFGKIIKIVKDYSIDIIHSHFGYKLKILLNNRRKLGNVKLLFHDHMDFTPGVSYSKQKIKTYIYALMYRLNGVGVISVMQKKDKAYRLAGKKNHWYVPNGLSLLRNVGEHQSREETRAKLGIQENEKLCLFLGWDLYRKGLDIAVKAIEKYREESPNLVLGIIGLGTNPNESAVNFIEEKTGINAKSPWIRYLDSVEDIFAYDRAADVYLSSSRAEAFSYGILEAISQNTPVVASDIEGTSWALKYDKCVSYPVNDPEGCAKAIKTALSYADSKSNAQDIIDEYSIDKWCCRIIDIYNSVLKINIVCSGGQNT